MPKAAIYTRLSQDRAGDKTGTRRQEADCRALCKREGLTVARVYVDDDRSAYNGTRPAFEELLANLDQYEALVFWKVDRLTRRAVEFWKMVEACQRAEVRLVSVVDPVDTSSPLGRGVAGMVASMGEQESWNTSLRVTRKHAEAARAGKPHGHRRAFGYDKSGTKVVAKEARAIREARDRIFRGNSMSAICDDWNRRGVKPTTAPAWRVSTFKRMITGAKIAGLRQYKGEIVATGDWPAIISPAERNRIIAILGDPRIHRRGRPAAYLLSGIIKCGLCGNTLHAGVHSSGGRKWGCSPVPGDDDRCGGISVKADPVDDLVEQAIVHRLDSATLRRALSRKPKNSKKNDAVAIVADLEKRIVQLGIDHDDGLISRKEWLERRSKLTARLEQARAQLVPDPSSDALAQFVEVDVRAQWSALTLDKRRAIARALIDEVVIRPATGGNMFDRSRVEVAWRV